MIELLANNKRYQRDFHTPNPPAKPRRKLAIVTCMDSRVDPFGILGLENGDAHIIRNAGGIITDDVLRSLSLSRWLLGTRHILIIQHTRCGLHGLDEAELASRIEAAGLRPSFAFGRFDDLAQSVRASVQQVLDHPLLGWCSVQGATYDVDTGQLEVALQ